MRRILKYEKKRKEFTPFQTDEKVARDNFQGNDVKKLKFVTGFTLVELLIYSMIFTVAAGLLTGVLIAISGIQTKENAAFEVTRQLQFVTQRVQYAIRDASVVEGVYEGDTEGTTCTTYCSIKLRVEDPALDPTIISSDIGGVYMKEGTGPKTALTTTNVQISSLLFTKVGNPGGLSTVTVDIAMVFNPDDPRLRVEKNLASAIAHVSAATFDSDLLPDETETRNIGGVSLKWNNLVLSGGITITGPDAIGEQIGLSMARGASHGLSTINQYYVTSTPYNKYGQRYDVGGTPMFYLEGDIGQSSRRIYLVGNNIGIGTAAITTISADAGLFPSVAPKLEVITGTSAGAYKEAVVIRHTAIDSTAVSRELGLLLKASSENNATESNKMSGMMWWSSAAYGNSSNLSLVHANSKVLTVNFSGNVGIGITDPGGYKLNVNGTSYFSGNAYFTADVSALSFTDRTPYPENLGVAYDAVLSMKKLPDGIYDPNNKENQLDHSSLTDFVRGTNGDRDLSATVSAQNEVIKDLIKRIEELENKDK
ncbi:MAG: hypothetical protein WC519_00045 [Parcubacteria group bacterium]